MAEKTRLCIDDIRFYEKKQLIQPSSQADNNYLYYDDETLKRLIFIKRCRVLDMSLKEIELLIELEQKPDQDYCVVNNVIDEHLKHIESKISELQKFQLQLQQL
ncbi:transcriptional regulator [Acinetobacter terrae]|nr:transcriptional regulator [Acinetobacter terrae]